MCVVVVVVVVDIFVIVDSFVIIVVIVVVGTKPYEQNTFRSQDLELVITTTTT